MSDAEQVKTRWSERRDMLAATREGMIVTAAILLFVAPTTVRATLERAGISAFAGIEFDIEDVVDANEQVAVAEAEVSKLADQLANVESKLESMSEVGRAKPEQIRELASAVTTMKTQADQVDVSLKETNRKMDRAIKLMPPEKLRELAERNAQQAANNYLRHDTPQQQQAWLEPPPQMMIQQQPPQSARIGEIPPGLSGVEDSVNR